MPGGCWAGPVSPSCPVTSEFRPAPGPLTAQPPPQSPAHTSGPRVAWGCTSQAVGRGPRSWWPGTGVGAGRLGGGAQDRTWSCCARESSVAVGMKQARVGVRATVWAGRRLGQRANQSPRSEKSCSCRTTPRSFQTHIWMAPLKLKSQTLCLFILWFLHDSPPRSHAGLRSPFPNEEESNIKAKLREGDSE